MFIHFKSKRLANIVLATCFILSIPLQHAYARPLDFDDLVDWSRMVTYIKLCRFDDNIKELTKVYGADIKAALSGVSPADLEAGFKMGLELVWKDYQSTYQEFGKDAGSVLFCMKGEKFFSSTLMPYIKQKYANDWNL